ncbi:MAG TPA: hypothetical protein PK970_03700, partial [Hyphomicrobiaceae bacterium]|nr:hypothetical protein [Hyphomicrobiaceae bacterium]
PRTVPPSRPVGPAASARRELDRPAPAIAIGTGRLGPSDEAFVVIRRSQQPNLSVSDRPAASRTPTSDDIAASKPLHTLAHDQPDAVVAILRRPYSESPANIALDDRGDASVGEAPETESPSDSNTEASVTILRIGTSPPRSNGGSLSDDTTSRPHQRNDWYAGHLNEPAPRTGLLAFTRKLHRSWRRN